MHDAAARAWAVASGAARTSRHTRDGPVPFPGLAQDHGQAGQAELRRRLQPAGRAERERVVVGGAGGGVVAGVLERVGQPLVDLGGGRGEVAVERHGERGAHELEPLAPLARPRAHVALERQDARLEVGAAGGARVGARELEQLQRRPEAGRRAQVGGGGQPFGGRVARRAARREGRGGLLARGQRLVPPALQLQRAGQPARRLGDGQRLALAPAAVDDLAPRPDGLARLAGELGAARQALQRLRGGRARPRRPATARARAAPRGRRRGTRGRRRRCSAAARKQRRARSGSRACAQCSATTGPGRPEPLGHLAVQRPPLQQRDLAVERVAHERVPERHLAGRPVDQDAAADRVLRPLVQAGDRDHGLGVEALAGDGGHGDRRCAPVGDRPAARSSTASRTLSGSGSSSPSQQLEAGRRRTAAARSRRGRAQLRHEERHAVGAIEDRVAQAGRGRRPEHVLEQRRRGGGVERFDRDLAQPAVAPQLAAQPPDRMAAGNVVAAVGADAPVPAASSDRASAGSRSSVASSAHCRSSRNTASGARVAAARASTERIAANSVARSTGAAARRARAAAGPGSARAAARRRVAGARAAHGPQHLDDRPVRRGALLHAEAVKRSRPEPASTVRASVVLPTPASPASRTIAPSPARARAASASRAARSTRGR